MNLPVVSLEHWWLLPASFVSYALSSMLGIDGAAVFLPM